ncbi:hypothetical protein [Thiopseudomonas acetoxidans]|uniref:Uncharacterized protein n=1 Tax=Thiopseudomonas acetoxidans TaxID=3041622 RepID=A0ABT7SR65_9GAMM|nr:hypothetical protein [Thiopseudomonas sp. CY1220]MDM7858651.1 hypothetical protein [Thiopseudomonas sp. CY1220]
MSIDISVGLVFEPAEDPIAQELRSHSKAVTTKQSLRCRPLVHRTLWERILCAIG